MDVDANLNMKVTHHLKPFDQSAEVGVFLVVLDQGRLNTSTCTLYIHTRPIHLSQVNPLQVP